MARRAPSYRLHKPSGRAVVTIAGKDYYLGVHGSAESKAYYNRLIAAWNSSGQASSFGVGMQQVTIAMLLADYLEFCAEHYPTNGKNSELDQIKFAVRYLADYHDVHAFEFGPLKLKAVRNLMLEASGKHGRKLSRDYINGMIDRIKRMFRWGVENELVPSSVYEALRAVTGLRRGRCMAPEGEPVGPVDDSVVEATLKHCSPTLAAMIQLQQLTGMRPGEVCGLKPSMVNRSGKVWLVQIPQHKNTWRGKDRVVYLGPKAQAVLLPFLLRHADDHCFSPAESEHWRRQQLSRTRRTPPKYGNRPGSNRRRRPRWSPGSAYTVDSYRRAIVYATTKAFPKPKASEQLATWKATYLWSPNQLRHNAATKIRKLYGLEAAQVVLGHSRADVTEIYAEKNLAQGMEIALAVG